MEFIFTTPDDLRKIINECLESRQTNTLSLIQSPPVPEKHLHSIKELAVFLGCSTTKAQALKNKKKIRYRQFGRKVFFVASEVLEDLRKK